MPDVAIAVAAAVAGAVVTELVNHLRSRRRRAWLLDRLEIDLANLSADLRELAGLLDVVQVHGSKPAQDAHARLAELDRTVDTLRDRLAGIEGLVAGLMGRHRRDDGGR